jgi:hypothetical protein
MDCRLSSLDFDIAASAGWYSAIAGLLAGFALLSILLPLDHEAADPDESQSGNAVVVFTCAFVSLLALGFAFAVLAGRTGDGDVIGVAAHEQVVYGSAFGLAAILMLFGLHAVLRTYGANRAVFGPAQRVIVLTTSVLAPVVLLALQFGSALDVTRFRAASDRVACDVGGLPNTVWIDLGIVAIASSALVLMWLLRGFSRSAGSCSPQSARSTTQPPSASPPPRGWEASPCRHPCDGPQRSTLRAITTTARMLVDDASDHGGPRPYSWSCIALITSSTISGGTTAISLPSLAMLIASSPRNEHAAATAAGTGIRVSSYSMPRCAAAAISHSDAATPPRSDRAARGDRCSPRASRPPGRAAAPSR